LVGYGLLPIVAAFGFAQDSSIEGVILHERTRAPLAGARGRIALQDCHAPLDIAKATEQGVFEMPFL
jgi:hypothetical protein